MWFHIATELFNICQKHICCVIFYWHTLSNNLVYFKIFACNLTSICLHTYKTTMFFLPCFGKYFCCSTLSNCLLSLYLHTGLSPITLPLSPSVFFLIICTEQAQHKLEKRHAYVQMGTSISWHNIIINNKHQARLHRLWNPSNLQGLTCTYKPLLSTASVIIHVQYICLLYPQTETKIFTANTVFCILMLQKSQRDGRSDSSPPKPHFQTLNILLLLLKQLLLLLLQLSWSNSIRESTPPLSLLHSFPKYIFIEVLWCQSPCATYLQNINSFLSLPQGNCWDR